MWKKRGERALHSASRDGCKVAGMMGNDDHSSRDMPGDWPGHVGLLNQKDVSSFAPGLQAFFFGGLRNSQEINCLT